MTKLSRRRIAWAGGALALGLLFFLDPAVSLFAPPCVFRSLSDISCPGCGCLRALHALLHARVADAWHLNPLVLVGLVLAPLASAAKKRARNT